MRDLADYSLKEWLAGAPLAHRLRRARNRVVDLVYARRQADGQAALVARLKAERAPALAFTVAFNMPEAIDLLAQAMARFLPGTPLVVCDNSTDPAARAAIAALCAERDIAYCPLPPSPYRGGRNGSRSHAVALNWIWAKPRPSGGAARGGLARPRSPPASADDLTARVAVQPCYALARHGEGNGAWYLWPGFRLVQLQGGAGPAAGLQHRTPLTLDTGGQNWNVLYRRLDRDALAFAETRTVFVADPGTGTGEDHLLVDGWLHAGGAGHGTRGRAFDTVARAFAADPDVFSPGCARAPDATTGSEQPHERV